jgi:hypothetical protein
METMPRVQTAATTTLNRRQQQKQQRARRRVVNTNRQSPLSCCSSKDTFRRLQIEEDMVDVAVAGAGKHIIYYAFSLRSEEIQDRVADGRFFVCLQIISSRFFVSTNANYSNNRQPHCGNAI